MKNIQTALITGASRGLGRALLLHFAKRGVRVAGVARARGALDDVIKAAGGNGFAVVGDIGAPGIATRLAQEAAAAVGDIDLVVHNASTLGPVPLRPLADVTEDEVARVFAVNVTGPLALTRALVGNMVVRGTGTVVFISSDAAVEAYPGWGPYGAAKAAADHAARVMAAELEGTGVRVLAIDPGEMNTDMHRDALPDADPASLADPAHVAAKIVRVLDDDDRVPARWPSGSRVRAAEVLL